MNEGMNEVRTQILDQQTKIDLCRSSRDPSVDILELVPSGLSPEEIDSVGLQVANLTEAVSPSRDGFSRGRATETEVVRSIGFAAAVAGDVITARSASAHLGRRKLSISNWIARGMIGLQIRNYEKGDNPLQTS